MNLSRVGGSSKDCICTRSSLTAICRSLPPMNGVTVVAAGVAVAFDIGSPSRPPQPISDDAVAGAGDMAAPPWRAIPMASNSSMKPTAPPFLRAALRSARKNWRTFRWVAPWKLDWNDVAVANRNGTPASAASAFAV